ncbi:MAG: TetR/AcrR family transcriptional regulator [Candidatus Limnocylindria bacterium]
MGTQSRRRSRVPVSRDRILNAAIALADEGGIESLTMRRIGQALGVEAMALYRHVTNKYDIVDGMVDVVFSEIDLPAPETNWKTAMRERAISVREALSRHRWAVGLMESRRNPGPANLRHHDTVIGTLRAAGFDMATAAHVYPLLDSYIYGFAMTQMNLPFESSEEVAEVAQEMLQVFPVNAYPNLAAFITEHAMKPGYDHGSEFEWGLDVILNGLEAALATA